MKRVTVTLLRRVLVLLLVLLTGFLFIRSLSFSSDEETIAAIPRGSPKKPTIAAVGDDCLSRIVCSAGTLEITLSSESEFTSPVVCFNRSRLFKETDLTKGLNFVVLNEKSHAVESVQYISLLDGDHDLIQRLSNIKDHRIIIVASYGDVASKLSAEARQSLGLFGSSSLEKYSAGTSLLLIGQRGLVNGKALEKVSSLGLPSAARSSSCISVPMGELLNVTRATAVLHRIDESKMSKLSIVKGRKMDINYGRVMEDCGLAAPCDRDKLAMSFYSGKDKEDAPRLCVNGRFVIERDVNGAGRGLNLVVIDVKTRQTVRVGHFDTYDQDDADLILFLEQLMPGEIVAVVSFDEASSKLSDTAKKIFYELGSSLIHDIKFRASWYFVGQKGIDSFSPFEDLIAPAGNDWAKPIDLAVCVPLNLNSLKVARQTALTQQNTARRHFCENYDGYTDFCREDRLDAVLAPKPLSNRLRSSRPVYSLPIVLVGGLNRNNIRLSLESLHGQEGINVQNVVVTFDSAYPEIADLTALFHARSLPITNASSYNDMVLKSISHLMELYPSSPCIIVIEEDELLAPDFLFFIDQLLKQFLDDETANVLQIFNKNGYSHTSSISSAVYRFKNSTFSKAFVLKRIAFDTYIRGKEESCCKSINEWLLPGISYAPDVSRIALIQSDAIHNNFSRKGELVSTFNRTDDLLLKGAAELGEEAYDVALQKLIMGSIKMSLGEVADCQPGSALASPVTSLGLAPGQSFAVIFSMKAGALSVLFNCFHLSSDLSYGMYKGVVRFSIIGHPALLVSRSSSLIVSKGNTV